MIKSMNKDLFEKLCDEGLAYIYVIKLHDEVESFYKIGVTSKENTYDRVSSFPYKVEIIDELGVKRIASCDYKRANVKKASDESTINLIHRTFKVGETYSNTFIKKKLQNFGLAKAKASTLAEYFELKKGKTKDRKDGYKIMRGL